MRVSLAQRGNIARRARSPAVIQHHPQGNRAYGVSRAHAPGRHEEGGERKVVLAVVLLPFVVVALVDSPIIRKNEGVQSYCRHN